MSLPYKQISYQNNNFALDLYVTINYLCNSASATNENCLLQSCGDVEHLRRERGKLLATMSGLKRKVADIEQQEEELLREV